MISITENFTLSATDPTKANRELGWVAEKN